MAAIVTGIVTEVRAQMMPQLAQLETRTAALEQRTPRDGTDGRDGTHGRDGVDGREGTDGRPGVDGRDGSPGRDGVDGRDADPAQLLALQARLDVLQAQFTTRAVPTLEDLRPVIEGAVAHALAAVPKAKDGISLTGALLDRAGHLVLTRSEGAPIDVGLVTGASGPTGAPGRDGRDAAFKGAIVLKCLDARTFEWCWSADGSPIEIRDAADRVIPSRFQLPIPMHKGIWASGPYDPHDVVTHDGSQWLARAATTTRPGNGASDWMLVVKRGAQGPKGEPGPPGAPGRDVTQMDFEGRKW